MALAINTYYAQLLPKYYQFLQQNLMSQVLPNLLHNIDKKCASKFDSRQELSGIKIAV